jgi:orotate phosphoribosyltransferase
MIIGAPVQGRVLIVDDVITAGTAIGESVQLLRQAGGNPVGVLIALDRQEKGQGALSAVQEVERSLGVRVASIICLDDLIDHLSANAEYSQFLPLVEDYRARHGAPAAPQ